MIGFEWMHGASHFGISTSSSTNAGLSSFAHTLIYWDAGAWQGHHVLHHHVYTRSLPLDPDTTHLYPMLRKTVEHPGEFPVQPMWLKLFEACIFLGCISVRLSPMPGC